MKTYFVYILSCSDGSFYTGMTSNLDQRLFQHKSGFYHDSYTFSRRPVKLMFYSEFTEVGLAIQAEKQIKNWSRAKKIALINNEMDELKNLAKKKFNK